MQRMTEAESKKLDAMLAKMERERARELAKDAKSCISKSAAEEQYNMLRRWSRKGVLTKVSATSTFWTKGTLMTMLQPSQVNGLVKYGYAKLSNDGWTLTLIKGASK